MIKPTKLINLTIFAFIAIVFAVVGVNGQGTGAKPAPTPLAKPSANTTILEAPEVDGWERGDKQTFPTAELGYSYGYESEDGGRVTLYVYNGGRKSIPSELTGIVNQELQQAKSDIKAYEEMGYYKDVKMEKDETITLGGSPGKVKALHTFMTFSSNGLKLDSEIYIFAFRNHFIKIRATRPSANKAAAKPVMDALLASIGSTFSEK